MQPGRMAFSGINQWYTIRWLLITFKIGINH